ncbi:MAG: CHRD domain-containing protein [Burkholderiales bacterium]|nr:CHRD domain-containing protein [Burkholderiales bacterium]
MRISMSRRAVLMVGGLALAGSMNLANAAPLSFTVPLDGAHEVPAVQSPGSGSAALTYDPATHVVTWDITFSGLSSAATMAHIHAGAAGKNGPVKVWLSKKGAAVSSPIKGEAKLSPADAKAFLAGDTYINVHTKDHPAGEIRGQVTPPKGQ